MNTLWQQACIVFLVAGLLAASAAHGDALEQRFLEPTAQDRELLGPLFWLHGDESANLLTTYVGKVAEGGNGCFTAESRPHNDWLGEGWRRDLDVCLDAAKQNGLKMWIFDEAWWPSGEVGGRVPQEYASKRLQVAATEIAGPRRIETAVEPDRLVAVLAGKKLDGGIDSASLIDLTPSVRDGAVAWDAPKGAWQLLVFTWDYGPKRGGNYLVDGASADAVDWYIRTVYQPHYDWFSQDFGDAIRGFFYDEPETYGDWGTEVIPMLKERGVDWMRALVAWKLQLADPEEQIAAKYQYQDAQAEAWGRTLYGGVTKWCEAHGVKSIGHFLEHANCYLSPDLCAGNMFQLQKYSSMGAIDAVFDQFIWGKRITRDAPIWQTPKMGSSVTHAYGKPDDVTMVEIFGARGQDLTYPEMKWWADHMQVSGINFLIPHSFNPRSPYDSDCPPYFYDNGFEPRWPLYRVFADYSCRLSLLLSGGRHVCPVALLYLGNSAHAGKAVTPEQMSEVLQDALYDCDWIPYDVFEDDMTLDGATLRLRDEAYRILIVPPVEVIPYDTFVKAQAFFEQGGVVVGHGFLPSQSATLGRSSKDIARVRAAVWGDQAAPGLEVCKTNAAGGRSYLLPKAPTVEDLQQVLATSAGVRPTLEVLEGKTDNWLHVLHRVKDGRDVFFVCNQNHTGEARTFRLRLTADGVPECWDAMRKTVEAIPFERDGGHVDLSITLEPLESILFVFNPDQRDLPMRGAFSGGAAPVSIAVVRDATPPEPVRVPDRAEAAAASVEGLSWVWYPEGDPAASAPPGTRYFRKQFTLPDDRANAKAIFIGACDNSFTLYVNGEKAGNGDGWQSPVTLDVTARLHPGVNQLAIEAVNASNQPNPAGLIGHLTVTFGQGDPLDLPVDASWKAANAFADGWTAAGFNDAPWAAAAEVARFGAGPWGRMSEKLTLAPVQADPFVGHCDLPANVDPTQTRLYLEAEGIAPEAAARVTVNGQYAGGFIGKPFRIEIAPYLKAGRNDFRIEPFAPASVRLVGE